MSAEGERIEDLEYQVRNIVETLIQKKVIERHEMMPIQGDVYDELLSLRSEVERLKGENERMKERFSGRLLEETLAENQRLRAKYEGEEAREFYVVYGKKRSMESYDVWPEKLAAQETADSLCSDNFKTEVIRVREVRE